MITARPTVDKALNLTQLRRIPMQRPDNAGAYWQGIPHGDLASCIIDACTARSWGVTNTRFITNRGGSELAGVIDVDIPKVKPPKGQSFSLGFLTSNDRKRALKLTVGTNVFVCSNGLVTGEIILRRKHTLGLDLAADLNPALDTYVTKAQSINEMVERLRDRKLKTTMVDKILMEAGRAELMPWSRIGDVDHEYRNPRFAEHGKDTSWALLQAFTWVVKQNPPLAQMEQINSFRKMLPMISAA